MEEKELEDRIVDAIRAKNAKQLLQQRESRIVRGAQQRRRVFVRAFTGLAAAACIAFGVIHFDGISTYKSYGDHYYSTMELPVSRGGDDAGSLLQTAYEQIGATEYAPAHENINAAIALLASEQFDLSTEEGQYFAAINARTMDDAKWLKAVAYMKQGKRHKARILLREIAASDGVHKTEAQEILN